MKKEIIYLNFPISILRDAFCDIKKVLHDVVWYAIYKQSRYYGDSIGAAAVFFRIPLVCEETAKTQGEILHILHSGKMPSVSLDKQKLLEFYTQEKSEFEIACLCAFCAIKSIIGSKDYVFTNKALIIARMFGFAKPEDFNDTDHLQELKAKYSQRYHIDRVIKKLELEWGLRKYGNNNRGFYLSFSEKHESLAKICENNKLKNKLSQLADIKRLAKEKAEKELKEQQLK